MHRGQQRWDFVRQTQEHQRSTPTAKRFGGTIAADVPSPLAFLGREGREQATPRLLNELACLAEPALRKPPA